MRFVIASVAKQSSVLRLRHSSAIPRLWRFSWIAASLALLAMTLFLAACAPQQQSYNVPSESRDVPAITDVSFVAADGTVMPVKSWLPKGRPKAVIVALHGFNDYSNAFAGAGEYFRGQGIAVIAYDQRGFGKGPQPGIWANEQNLVSDLQQAVRQVKRRWPQAPVYLLGESMGGAVVISAVTDPQFPKVQGIILSAPAVWGDEAMPWLYSGTLWLAAHTIPDYRLTGSDLKILASNNLPMLERLCADPLVIKKTRVDAIYGVVQLMNSAYAKVPDIKTRVLLLYGGEDQVIPHPAIDAARERFTAPLTYTFYPDGYHMLMRDIQGRQVMEDVKEWIVSAKK